MKIIALIKQVPETSDERILDLNTGLVDRETLCNLNHMYGVRDADDWVGFWIFAASVVVMVAIWAAARPLLRPVVTHGEGQPESATARQTRP